MKLDYGKNGIELEIDPNWNTKIIQPVEQFPIESPIKAIRDAIKNPMGNLSLKAIIKNRKKIKSVCIVVSDVTRPVPTHLILEGLLKELNDYGIQEKYIRVLIATGLHRPSRKEELNRILGVFSTSDVKIINHIATDKKSLVSLHHCDHEDPIYINRYYYESDLKILTGYVEPHFFFGFSGGYKSIVPGLAGTETILANHSAENIASPYARFGIYENNPLPEHSSINAKIVGVDFTINVCINKNHEITQIAAGDLELVHKKLVDYQNKHVFKEIQEPFDIVVCGNGGYPLDLNLYQAVKSMAIGEMGVKRGGTIISVNECSEGIGVGQNKFKELIFSEKNPEEIYDKILKKEIVVPDQWEIQVLTRILMKSEIYLVSTLKEEEIGNIGLKYADTVENAIKNSLIKHGSNANILILPNGPQILPLINI
ncbi:MAG TPA: nickel-dependent lactate racemase [Candidatus Nanopelagicaceae bacterium]|nr:nickel-dependent lactate racemase [Candidatus Nanopelagicaceae bacterium]